jgi:hypothetical protein
MRYLLLLLATSCWVTPAEVRKKVAEYEEEPDTADTASPEEEG